MKHLMIGCISMTLMVAVSATAGNQVPENDNDKINYSVGFQVGSDFKRHGVDLAPESFLQGLQDAVSDKRPLLHPTEMQAALVALKKKIDAAAGQEEKQAREKRRAAGKAFLTKNAKKQGVETLPSGLQYEIIKKGTGKNPGPEDIVTVRYRGTKRNGTEFDSSAAGTPASFRVNSVIPGWAEALQLMQEGAKWRLFLPPDLAFGARGPLADQVIIYEVELLSVQPARASSEQPDPPEKES